MPVQELIAKIDGLLKKKEDRRLRTLLLRQKAPDLARALNRLRRGRRKAFAMLPPETQAEVAVQLTLRSKIKILPRIPEKDVARLIHFNDEDDAADILQSLPRERRGQILRHMRPERRAKIEKLLTFHPETAGGLMDLNFVTVKADATPAQISARVKAHVASQDQTPMVIVMGRKNAAVGYIPYRGLMLGKPGQNAEGLMHTLHMLPHGTDQERVLRLAMREQEDVFGVADERGKFLGVIHLRDLLKIAQAEATEDLYKFAGVSPEEHALDTARTAVKMRYHWLIVNLATAFLAAWVVGLFEGTIARHAILAAYMPIVAGMGGNAGTQSLAVVVRGLAMREMVLKHTWRVLLKEVLAGLANGLINGVLVAGIVYMWQGTAAVGLILAAAMIINLIVAGIAGTLIPVILKYCKVDPAVASTVFVTTFTDVCGFFAFLGLASIFLS